MIESKASLRNEWAVVPAWPKALATVLAVALAVVVFWAMGHGNSSPPVAVQVSAVVFGGLILAAFVMLIGYANRDAATRECRRTGCDVKEEISKALTKASLAPCEYP